MRDITVRNGTPSVVGYTNANVPANEWQIVAVQFEDVAAGEVDLQKFCSGFTTTVGYDDDYKTLAPCIQIQKRDASGNILGTGNTFYYYIKDAAKDSAGNTLAPGWADVDGNYVGEDSWKAAVKILPGTAVWFKDPQAAATGTSAGAVVGESTAAPAGVVGAQWALVSNPYPVAFDLNSSDIIWSGMTTTVGYDDDYQKEAPCVQVQKRDPSTGAILGTGNTFYYYIKDAAKDSAGNILAPGWADVDGNYVGEGSWKAGVTVPATAGFWFKDPSNAVSITFKK